MKTNELPYQTFERVLGIKWPGGTSKLVRFMLQVLHIYGEPGTAEVNLRLQEIIANNEV